MVNCHSCITLKAQIVLIAEYYERVLELRGYWSFQITTKVEVL